MATFLMFGKYSPEAVKKISADRTEKTVKLAKKYQGKVVMIVTDPGATAPSDNYDLYIKDSAGVDIMNGTTENRDTANSEQAMPKWGTDYFHPRPVYGALTFSLSGNSVDSALGEVFIYMVED